KRLGIVIDAHRGLGIGIRTGTAAGIHAWRSRPGVTHWHGLAWDDAQSRVGREHIAIACKPFCLAKAFIVAEDEEPILEDGSTGRGAKQIALERRIRAIVYPVEVRPRVQRAVAKKFVNSPVELVRAGAADTVHHAAGRAAILGRESAGQD